MTDFRALCAELADSLEAWQRGGIPTEQLSGAGLVQRARAALAEAYEAEANNPPEGHPDPEPFQAILRERAAALAQPEPQGPTLDDILELCADHEFMLGVDGANEEKSAKGLLEIICAALTRWGRPAIEPVPQQEAQP